MFTIIKQIADVWAVLTVGAVAGGGFLALAYFVPVARQIAVGLAAGCFLATFAFGYGVKQERDVWKAREFRAELLRQERDTLQAKLAGDDEARRAAGLEAANRKEEESDNDFAKRLKARPACFITDGDIR